MTMASGLYVVTFRDAMIASPIVMKPLDNTNKVILVTNTHTPNFDTHNDYADITNELPTATGYTQNSKTVGGTPTWDSSGADGILKYSWSTTVQWTSATFTARGMIVTSSVATGLLLVAVTFGADYTCTSGTFTITAAAGGIFSIDMVP